MAEYIESQFQDYATHFKKFSMKETRFLSYRDIPILIKKYVNGTTALDYGCGPGHSTAFLKSLGLQVKGVDMNEFMIQNAQEHDPEGDYVVIQSAEIPNEDQHYDLIFAGFVLIYVSTKNELVKILSEVTRVLKVGGIFLAIVTNNNSFTSDYITADTNFEENKNLSSGSICKKRLLEIDLVMTGYFWTYDDYQEVMSAAGLSIIEVHEPLGKDSDGYGWKDEKVKPPVAIYVAKKIN